MSPGTRLSVLLVAVLLASTGCGEPGASEDPPDAGSTPTSGTPTSSTASPAPSTSAPTPTQAPTPSPTPTPTPTPTSTRTRTPPSEALEKIRVVGEVTSTGDCVVVRDGNGISWTLVGEQTDDLQVGDKVTATGAPDLTATGCGGSLVRTTKVTVTD